MLRQLTMLLGRDPGEPPELLLSIERVRGRGDDPLFLSQIHILIFKAMIIYWMGIISSSVDKARIWPAELSQEIC